MIQDRQVKKLHRLLSSGKTLVESALRTGMSERTARKYRSLDQLPSETRTARTYRTRQDPLEPIWPSIEEQLLESPGLQAKTLLEWLCRESIRKERVRVCSGSLVQVSRNTYSVHSRLIGEEVEARIHMDHVEIWYAQKCVDRFPRLRGRDKHLINYRHIIDWLVRKKNLGRAGLTKTDRSVYLSHEQDRNQEIGCPPEDRRNSRTVVLRRRSSGRGD